MNTSSSDLEMQVSNKFRQLSSNQADDGEKKTTSFKVSVRLHKLLKICAALENKNEGELLNEAISDLLIKYRYLESDE